MIEYSELDFKNFKMYWGKKSTGFSVVEDITIKHPTNPYFNMFRVRSPDGTLSEDYYNYTRAKDHCRKIYQRIVNDEARLYKNNADTDLEKPVGAFKSSGGTKVP